ncbi:hypothetical protein [Microcoleus sp. PH2017_36_ELK_O_B]|uniref:hypothetical protein n=1 Tax=Microcoleus sp. PH2017_36_ELK_O_B TaxID=2798846 RepID=UPI0025E99420|nr:hypothetical protein [Microcoleus sp. PH2017_36_ELK_O_B]
MNSRQRKATPSTKDILQKSGNFSLLMPSNQNQLPTAEIGALVSPFFYQDNLHTFFVEPTLTETTIERYQGWVVAKPKPATKFDDDWWKQIPVESVVPRKPLQLTDPIDPIAKFQSQQKQDWVINFSTVLQFGETLIGQTGRVDRATLPAIGNIRGMSGAILQGRGYANAQPEGELASIDPNISLNVIDSSGLNSALLENLSANLNIQNINSRMRDRFMNR